MSKESLLLHAGEDTIHSNQIELKTRKDKFKHWWHYSRFIILGVVIIAIAIFSIVYSVLNKPKPDYQVLLMTYEQYPTELVDSMQDFLETVADDRNKDGKVMVELNNYVLFLDEKHNGQYAYDMFEAAKTRYATDVYYGDSMIYIYDAASFSALYEEQLFIYNDGSTPPEGAKDFANMMIPFADCKLFTEEFDRHLTHALFGYNYSEEYVDDLLAPLYVSFRCTAGTIWEEDAEQMDYYYDSWDLYQLFIEGRAEK